MATTFESLGLDKLSQDEKIILVHELWDDLDKSEELPTPLSDAQWAELNRRLEAIRSGNATWVSLAELDAEIAQRSGA